MKDIGIDAGGTLIKIAYIENNTLHTKAYTQKETNKLIEWIQLLAPNAILHLTGGKADEIKNKVTNRVENYNEFDTLIRGTKFLMEEEKQRTDSFILVSIGTGTSIFHVESHQYERILGTGVGGGTLLGLGSLLAGERSFQELIKLSESGNHQNTDLLVKDIYGENASPLLKDITAANFGKSHLNQNQTINDSIASLHQLIGEVILSLAYQACASKELEHIVFVGGTLDGNTPLKNIFQSFEYRLPYQAILLDKGTYAGAIGALFR